MAEGEGGGTDPWIWFFLVVLIAAFFSTGRSGGFFGSSSGIKFGSPSQSGTVEEEIRNANSAPTPTPTLPESRPTPTSTSPSGTTSSNPQTIITPTRDELTLQAYGSARLDYADEFIQLSAPVQNRGKVVITGMAVQNGRNETVKIGSDESGGPISLLPGEHAIISTGQSPRGYNFKINKCSGYLAQVKTYSPPISNFCPRLFSLPQVKTLSEKCQNFVERVNSCTTPVVNGDTDINFSCSQFIAEHASYAGCVKDFKNEADFDGKEWRIFLGRTAEFWRNLHDDVKIIDRFGKLVTDLSY